MQKLIILIFTLTSVGMFSPMLAVTDVSYAATKDELQKGACLGDPNCTTAGAETAVNDIITTVIDVFSWIVGLVAVIMVIFGGFRYITAAGDSTKTKTAKDTILYALIGLIIVALAQTIVKYVISLVT